MQNRTPRYVNMILGAWLLLSTFFWVHTSAQYANTWLVGAATIVVAAISVSVRPMRFVNTALGAWLLLSVWVLPTMSRGTVWNNIIVGLGIVIASLMTGTGQPARHRPYREVVAHP